MSHIICLLLGLVCLAGSAPAASVITRYQYDNASRLRRVSTETGGQGLSDKRMVYDELGRVKATRQLASPVADEVDISAGTGHDDAKDRISETAWDVTGNVVLERRKYAGGPNGYAATTYAYDALSRKAGMTDAEAHTTVYQCDNRGNITAAIDPESNKARFLYDAPGRPILEKRYEGASAPALQINRIYDSRGHKIIEIQGDGQAGETYEQALPTALTQQRWQYDALDRLILQAQMADPHSLEEPASLSDRLTRYTYVAHTKNPYQRITYTNGSYLERYTTFEYDPLGRPEKTTDPNGNTDEYTYVPPGEDGEGKVATRKVTNPGLTGPAGADISTQEFTYTYDWQGRKKTETAKGKGAVADRLTQYNYDDANWVQTVTNPKQIVTEHHNNAFGDKIKVVEDAAGLARTTEMNYDQLGRMDWQKATNTGGQEQVTSYEYDLLDQRKRITFPDQTWYAYHYDDAGRLDWRGDTRGVLITYTNNWRGQHLAKAVDGELKESFSYYATGWLKAAWLDTVTKEAATNKSECTCDAFGQATSVTQTVDGVSKTIASAYYPSGQRRQLVYPSGVGVTLDFTQDALGQTTEIQRGGNVLATYGYAGRKLLWRDVTTAGGAGTHVWFEVGLDAYRQQARLTNRTVVGGISTLLDQTDYTYDPAGNRKTAVITAGDQRLTQTAGDGDDDGYGYDTLDRLTTAAYPDGQSETFYYDLLGNRTDDSQPGYTDRQGRQTQYTANEVNEYTSITTTGTSTQAPQYDAAGNLTVNEHGYGFAYDHENRLVKVYIDSNASGQWNVGEPELASYTYDALGHRVKQFKNGWLTRYYYDGETIIAEYDGETSQLLRYHIHGPTYVDEHILLHEMAHDQLPEGEYYYLLGPLYGVTGLVDATGTVVERYRYDAYGLPTCFGAAPSLRDFIAFQAAFSGNQPASEPARIYDFSGDGRVDLTDYRLFFDGIRANLGLSPYRFTGQRLDLLLLDPTGRPVLALYNYRAREYDAYHGRFLQRDPAEYADSFNLYLAMRGNPLLYTDSTGQTTTIDLLIDALQFAMEVKNTYDTARTVRGYVEQIIAGAEWRTVALNAALDAATSVATGYVAGKALDAAVTTVGAMAQALSANAGKAAGWFTREAAEASVKLQAICFVAGTLVQTPHGPVPIELLRPGDLVVTRDQYDPNSELVVRPVKEVYSRTAPTVEWIVLANGEELGTTPEHVVWTQEEGWTLAGDLRAGQNLVGDNGDIFEIAYITTDSAPARTYNLNIDGTHTYFVGVSSVWVHNACDKLGAAGKKVEQIAQKAKLLHCTDTAKEMASALEKSGRKVKYVTVQADKGEFLGLADDMSAAISRNQAWHVGVLDETTGLVFDKFHPDGIPLALYELRFVGQYGAKIASKILDTLPKGPPL